MVWGMQSALRLRLRRAESYSDLALLINNSHFIPKKLLRDAVRDAFTDRGGDLVLDVGCGLQPYRRYLDGYHSYVGIDLDMSRIPNVVANVQLLPFCKGSAEAVLCTEVIEHCEDPTSVIRGIMRLLKPGGLIVLTAPMSWNMHYIPYDYWRFTRYGLERLLTEAGCHVIGVRRIGGLFALIGSRLADVLYRKIVSLLKPIPVVRHVASMMVVIPVNVLFFLLSCMADNLDHTDAIGWMVLAVQGDNEL